MVMEDNRAILDLFDMLLNSEGYKVFLYEHKAQELNEIIRIRPDLIILDYVVKKERISWQLLEILKLHLETAGIPVILCTTAMKFSEDQQDYFTREQVQVVFKPFNIDDLLFTVKKVLGQEHN